jgi:hypothetical protein
MHAPPQAAFQVKECAGGEEDRRPVGRLFVTSGLATCNLPDGCSRHLRGVERLPRMSGAERTEQAVGVAI